MQSLSSTIRLSKHLIRKWYLLSHQSVIQQGSFVSVYASVKGISLGLRRPNVAVGSIHDSSTNT